MKTHHATVSALLAALLVSCFAAAPDAMATGVGKIRAIVLQVLEEEGITGGGGGGEDLAATLAIGNTSGANDIVVSNGQDLRGETGQTLRIGTSDNSEVLVGGDSIPLRARRIRAPQFSSLILEDTNGDDRITIGTGAINVDIPSFRLQQKNINFDAIASITASTGSPEGVVAANVGSLYLREDGAASTTLYIKETGAGNTGWVAVGGGGGGGEDLAATLALGNTTGGTNLVISNGDEITGVDGGSPTPVEIRAGSNLVSGNGATMTVSGGDGNAGVGGLALVTGGQGPASAGGAATLTGGPAAGGSGLGGGLAQVTGGPGDGVGGGGGVLIRSGNSGTGASGNVEIDTGTGATTGNINIGPTNATQVTLGRSNGNVAFATNANINFNDPNPNDVSGWPGSRLLEQTSVNLNATGVTSIYSPGRDTIITRVVIRCNTAGAVTSVATAGVGVAAGEDDVYPSQPLLGFDAANEAYTYLASGVSAVVLDAGGDLNLGVDVAADASMACTVYVFGYEE